MLKRLTSSAARISICAAAGLAMAGTASASSTVVSTAESGELANHRTVVAVNHSDLDLTTEAGENALNDRVRQAAGLACDDALGAAAHPMDDFNCRVSAIRIAHRQVDDLVERTRTYAAKGQPPALASAISIEIRE